MARGRGGRPPSPTGRPCPAYKPSASERAGGREGPSSTPPTSAPALARPFPPAPPQLPGVVRVQAGSRRLPTTLPHPASLLAT